jgi:hypothetical protein
LAAWCWMLTARAGEAMEVGPDPYCVDIKQGDPRG